VVYTFYAAVRKEFESYDDYLRFRNRVDLAVLKLGFRSHRHFLTVLYDILYEMVDDDEVNNPKAKLRALIEGLISKRAVNHD